MAELLDAIDRRQHYWTSKIIAWVVTPGATKAFRYAEQLVRDGMWDVDRAADHVILTYCAVQCGKSMHCGS